MKFLSHRDALTEAMEKTAIPYPARPGVHTEWSYDVTRLALVLMGLAPNRASDVAFMFGGIPRKRLQSGVDYVNDHKRMSFKGSTE